MTRINIVSVDLLTDNFLLAEFYELPRMWPLIHRAIEKNDRQLPLEYTLGKGHLRFFYNKIHWLDNRHHRIKMELAKRRVPITSQFDVDMPAREVVDLARTYELLGEDMSFWFTPYAPSPADLQLNQDRLQFRRRYTGGVYTTEEIV